MKNKNHSKTEKTTSYLRWIIAAVTILLLNVSLSFMGNAQDKSLEPPEYKSMIFAGVGWPWIVNIDVTVYIDLDDLMLKSPDGQAGWTTIWISGGVGPGVSLLPGEIGYAKSQPNGLDPDGNEIGTFFDPNDNLLSGLSTNFHFGVAQISMSEGDNYPTFAGTVNPGVGFSIGTGIVSLEVKRSEVCDAIITASGTDEFCEILLREIFSKWGLISSINAFHGIGGAAAVVLIDGVRNTLYNGDNWDEKCMPLTEFENQIRALNLAVDDEDILCSVGHLYGRTATITPEMLHHGTPHAGKKIFHFFTHHTQSLFGEEIKFTLKDFPVGTEIQVYAHMMSGDVAQDQKDKVYLYGTNDNGYYPDFSETAVIAGANFLITDKDARLAVRQQRVTGVSNNHGYIIFEDVTYNSKKSGDKPDYTYYKGEYINKSDIKYPPIPDNVEKAPKIEPIPKEFCKETENKGSAPKGTIPHGAVVMCKDAGWFCRSSCFLYAINEVSYFRKGETYDYSGSEYWNAGNGPVIATFIYNYGCKGDMEFTCKFFKPYDDPDTDPPYYTDTYDYYCGNSGYWGYVAPGMYITESTPEGTWTLEFWKGSSLKKTVEFDIYSANNANRFIFINPTPAKGNTISGNWNNGQFHMTAAANGHVGGATKMLFYVDDEVHEEIQIHNPIGTSIWNAHDMSDGEHTIQAKINSTLGWLSTEKRTIIVNNTPPTYCNITSPATGVTITSPYTTVSVNTDAEWVEFLVDGASRGYDEQAPFSKEILLINNDASAEITAIGYNAAGKVVSTAKTVNIRCVYISSPETGADLPNDAVYNIDAKTFGTVPSNVKFYINGTYKFTDNSSPYIYPWNSAGYSGEILLKAVADYTDYSDTQDEINVMVGGNMQSWTETSNKNIGMWYGAGSAIMNGYIYAFGGETYADPNNPLYSDVIMNDKIERALINPDGSLDEWEICGTLSNPRSRTKAVHTKNYIYYVAGAGTIDFYSSVNTVDRIQINADGSIGETQILSSVLNDSRKYHEVVKAGNYIYALGGFINGTTTETSSVEYAEINNDGTLGQWQYTSSMNGTRHAFAAIAVNGYMYAMTGISFDYEGESNVTRVVERAKINENGTLGNWTILNDNSTLYYRYGLTVQAIGNFIYLISGDSPAVDEVIPPINTVERACVYDDGSLSPWTFTESLIEGRYLFSSAANGNINDAIYVFGSIGNTCLNVEYTRTGNGPTINSVASSDITSSSATITWTTNCLTNSRVDYWTDGSWPNFFSTDIQNTDPMVTSHSVTITEHLEPNTLYYYRVVSANDNGNTSMAGTYNFTTTGTNNPPVATASATPISGSVPLTVTFTGSGTDTDGTIASYYWQFDDGETSELQNPTHTYNSADEYLTVLTVTDNDGATGTDNVTISVNTGEDFDDGNADNWTLNGLWHVTSYRSNSPVYSLVYNQEAAHNYNTGSPNTGTATFDVNLSSSYVLEFDHFFRVESYPNAYDIARVQISTDEGNTWGILQQWDSRYPTIDPWEHVILNLNGYTGDVKIQFYFNTIDALYNNYEGWYIDNVVVKSSLTKDEAKLVDAVQGEPRNIAAVDLLYPNLFGISHFPNPFSSTVTIEYTIPESGNVSLEIYNIAGQLVSTLVNEQKTAGKHSVQWNSAGSNGNTVNAGIYFYKIKTGKFIQTKKMLLLK